MKTLRRILRGPLGRIVTVTLMATTIHVSADPSNYLTVLAVQQQREDQIRAIAAKMNVDPEFLLNPQGRTRFDFRSVFHQLATRLGLASESTVATNDQPLDIRESVQRVKERYALVAADTTLARIAQLVQMTPETARGKKKGQIKAELQSVLRLADKDFLPAVKDNASGLAKSRDAAMRREIKDLQKRVKSVLNAPHALDEANLESTLTSLRGAVNGTLTVRNSKPRWTRDPFPVKDTMRFANIKPGGPSYSDDPTGATAPAPAVTSQAVPSSTGARPRVATNAVAAEVAALANTLGTPAKIFAWVHDNIDWESYSGVAKGSLGTLQERSGNDWDQALLLRDLLATRGYDARLEWGRVTLPVAKAMNLVGTEDPLQAANLLATAGFDGLVLTTKNQPVAVQMTHAWVRALIPYIPNRGATAGTPDTWVRMDPSFKRYEYQAGISINGKVAWNEDEYLQTSTIRPPAEFYGDKIWSYIRNSNIDCINLSQVTKAGRIAATNYPFVPATLTTRIESVSGLAATPPADQMQSVTMNVTDINGAVLASYSAAIADVWGKKLSVTFPPATSEDAATIATYGGLFNTPAYLIKLKPVFSIDDQPVADGSPVAAGAVLDLNTTFRQPNVADDFTHHELVAGETHAIVLDPGNFPDALLQSRINRLKTLTNEDAILSEKLFLVGLRYMQHVDDGIDFSAGVRWQRPVKRVFEADVRRQIDITYNVAGAAVRLAAAENNIDVSRLLVGIVPINNDLTNRASALALAGLQSSYLEGAIWEEMESQQGISAAKALLLARMAGQQLHTVNAANVNTVLNQVNLAPDVEAEIRGAVAQGRIAKIPSANLQVNRWNGTGYILQDPATGAATYPISGGLAGGSTTDAVTSLVRELLGSEGWMETTMVDGLLADLLELLGLRSERAPSTRQSDPVNMSSGNMFRTLADISVLGRGLPVSITRTYNSRSSYNGPFGYGWTWSYGEQLTEQADGSVMYREADGTEHVFTTAAGAFVSPPGKHLDLTRDAGGWTITTKSGIRATFDARGLLVTQSDLNGNTVTVQRDANGHPVSIRDATGRTVLTFTMVEGKITRLTDLTGRAVSYGYDGDDLVSMTDLSGKVWTCAYDLNHNMAQFSDPLGNTQSYDYDSDDRVFHHVDAAGADEFFQYDIAGRQSVISDARGGDRYLQFDDDGRATLEADSAGNVAMAAFDAQHNRTSVTSSRGATATYQYDPNGNMTRYVAFDGAVTTASYDTLSRPVTMTAPGGLVTSNSFDARGNLLQSVRTGPGINETSTNTYDSFGQMTSMTDARGNSLSLTWSTSGAPASRTDTDNQTTTFTTDPLGHITAVRDPAGNTTTMVFDAADRVVSTTDAHGMKTEFGYDDAGRRTSITTPRGKTLYTYDAEGRELSVTDPLGATQRIAYNAAGDVVSRTDARGNTERFEYDLAGRIVKRIDRNGGVWGLNYCASIGSAPCDVVDPAGRVFRQTFDAMGRVTAASDALGRKVQTAYDDAGRRITETDAAGNITRYGYDAEGRLTSVTLADGAVTSYTYDLNGNRLTRKDANGNVWSSKYDTRNRLIEESDPLGGKTTYTYDALGNLKTKKDAKGQLITYDYDVRRMAKITYPNGTTDTFQYDSLGRRTSVANAASTTTYAYDKSDRVTSMTTTTPQYSLSASWEYDLAGNPVKMTNRQSTVTYTYDAKDRLTQLSDPLFGTFRFGYDALSRRTSVSYPNGVTTAYNYDDASRLSAIATTNTAGAVLDAWSYAYDVANNRTRRTDRDGKSDLYRYDATGQLTEAQYSDGSFERFTYDLAGNRTKRADANGTVTYSYNAANQLLSAGTSTFAYDANGNVTTKTTSRGTVTFAYDARDRLLEINGVDGRETSVYDPDGRRIDMSGVSIENGQVRVFYDLNGNPILDWGTDNQTWTYRLYAPGIDLPLAEYRRTNNRKTYLHSDALGSVTAVTSTTGDVAYRSSYSAFGSMSRTSYDVASTRLGYTGRETAAAGMMQYRSRYYDPSVGRFLQRDTFQGEADSPITLQQYAYAWNQPVSRTDPYGTSPEYGTSIYDTEYLTITVGAGWVAQWVFWNVTGRQTNYYTPSYGPVSFNAVTLAVGYSFSLWPLSVTGSSMTLKDRSPSPPPSEGAFYGYTLIFSIGFVVGFGVSFTAVGMNPVLDYVWEAPPWTGPVGTTEPEPHHLELDGWHFRIKGRTEMTGSGLLTVGFDFGVTLTSGYTFGF